MTPLQSVLPHASPLIYGCMGFGGAWEEQALTSQQQVHAEAAVEAAIAAGITVFDHADIYTMGKAEQVFGDLLAARPSLRQNMVLQSKCGIRFEDKRGPKRYDLSKAWIIESVDGILQRLRTDHIDILLLHRPDPLMQPDEVNEAFAKLVESGKVSHFGVSNMHAGQVQLLHQALEFPLIVNQIEMSLTNLGWLEEGVYAGNPAGQHVNFTSGTLEQARQQDIQLQAWGALSQGKYTGAHCALTPKEQQTKQLVTELADKYGVSSDAVVLAWLLRHPAKIQPIIGSTNPQRIAACSNATRTLMSREDWYRLYVGARESELP